MKIIEFEMAVIARTVDDRVLIALMDGELSNAATHECVALLSCRSETAQALCAGVCSLEKEQME